MTGPVAAPAHEPTPCRLPADWRSVLRAAKLDPRAVLAGAAIAPGRLRAQRERLSIPEYFRFWEALARHSGDPLVGLHLGAAAEPSQREPLFVAMRASANAGEALALVSKYKRQLCPESLVMQRTGAGAVRLCFRWPDARQPPQVLVDLEFAFLLALCRRGTACPALRPLAVELRGSAPALVAPRRAFFASPVRVQAADDAIVFSAETLAVPFRRADAAMQRRLVRGFDAAGERHAGSVAARVRALLAERMPCGRPSLASVAQALALSVRSLQRELAREGTSFRALVDAVRNTSACGYLRETAFSAEEIAFLVGFEDPASFYRSFRDWNGVTPARFRQRVGVVSRGAADRAQT